MNSPSSFLGRLPLFTDVASGALARLEHRMRRREFAPRSLIVREGTADDSAFIILSGRVAVRRRHPYSGIDFLAEFERALLTRKPPTASVVALADRLDVANRHIGIDFVNLSRVKIDPRVLRLLPHAIVHEHKVVPISFANNRLTLAMTNPSKAKPSAAPSVDLLESDLIRELQLAADAEEPKAETKQDLMSASEDAPMEGDVTVRFRIDGVLQVVQKLPKRVQLGLISRFKILSRLDIAEKRLPQDGRISASMSVDL